MVLRQRSIIGLGFIDNIDEIFLQEIGEQTVHICLRHESKIEPLNFTMIINNKFERNTHKLRF